MSRAIAACQGRAEDGERVVPLAVYHGNVVGDHPRPEVARWESQYHLRLTDRDDLGAVEEEL